MRNRTPKPPLFPREKAGESVVFPLLDTIGNNGRKKSKVATAWKTRLGLVFVEIEKGA